LSNSGFEIIRAENSNSTARIHLFECCVRDSSNRRVERHAVKTRKKWRI